MLTLNEDLFDDLIAVEVPNVIASTPVIEDQVPDMPETGEDIGIANELSALIRDEWEAIEGYNNMLANLGNYQDMADVIKDIANEENNHVGMLQQLLSRIAPNTASIAEGEAEAMNESLEESIQPSDRLDIHDYVKSCVENIYRHFNGDAEAYEALKKVLKMALDYTIDEFDWNKDEVTESLDEAKKPVKYWTVLFATGENTREGVAFANSAEEARAKTEKQFAGQDLTILRVVPGRLSFESETIDGIPRDEYGDYIYDDDIAEGYIPGYGEMPGYHSVDGVLRSDNVDDDGNWMNDIDDDDMDEDFSVVGKDSKGGVIHNYSTDTRDDAEKLKLDLESNRDFIGGVHPTETVEIVDNNPDDDVDNDAFLSKLITDEAWEQYKDWEPSDVDLHKSINWAERQYQDYPVDDDTFDHDVHKYDLDGNETKNVKMRKYLRANPIFPPYYAAVEEPFDNTVGAMCGGEKHGKYGIHNRYETQDVYDMMSM